ncbi:hypothetical protein B0H65DRAFT_70693 [Neurospora tetraspora]|uniref:Uncharacterized protein n=1 Tax=Neurospora tetraspora TaxID=94610 RepID=A0AAE0MX70_9PEZI|nr:hypothetical protein B0H65DRAFT_70693 [Neurospora tetraspora]
MLVPLMFSPDLEGGTSKTSESQSETRFKPQLHTQKNHNSYNGTRTLPIATRVRAQHKPRPDSDSQAQDKDRQKRKSKRRSKSRSQEDESPLYEITLYYPHNRACTIYRSREDFSSLRTGLSSRSSSTAPQPLATQPSYNKTEGEGGPKEVAKWDSMLRKALERFAKSGHGRHSVEWFLRRRLGDCERMASGKGTGLPTGTTRRVKIKQPRDVDDTKITDERPGKQGDKVDDMGKLDEEAAATEGKCLHDKNKEEEDNVISKESWTDDEIEVVKNASVKDEKRYNNGKQPDRERDEADDNADDNSRAARLKGRPFTEVVIGLDSIPVCPFKPIPDLGKLEGSSLAQRRKNRQKIENTGRADQKTVHGAEEILQKNIDDADASTSDSALEVETKEESSSDGTTVLTPTSTSAGEMSPGDPPPNPALMYKLMFSRRASDSDWGQKILSLHEHNDSGANTL